MLLQTVIPLVVLVLQWYDLLQALQSEALLLLIGDLDGYLGNVSDCRAANNAATTELLLWRRFVFAHKSHRVRHRCLPVVFKWGAVTMVCIT